MFHATDDFDRQEVVAMKVRAAALLGVIALAATGCGATSPAKQDTGPIVIGMPIALSGLASGLDGPFHTGAQLAVDDINASGGVLGRRLRIVSADAKSDPAQSATAAQTVINQGAKFILPTVDYDLGGPAARLAQSKGLVSMTLAGDPRFGMLGVGSLAFNIGSGGPTEGASAASFAWSRGWRRPYLLEDTSLAYSQSFCQFFRHSWKTISGARAASIPSDSFLNGDPSIASQITRLKAARPRPDFVVLCSYPPGGAAAVKQLRAAGINVPVVGGVAFDGTFWLPTVPKERNFYAMGGGVITGTDPEPMRAKVFSEYRAKTGKAPVNGIWALSGYSSIQALAKAITAAKSTKSTAVAAQLERFHDEPLAIGPTTWTAQCHVAVGRPTVVIRMDKGREAYTATVTPKKIPQAC
ncbi:ABC transporter substrate-binding protein [Wenjunlia tyrosinilytica]|uniref:Branched-chain amino acid ABC transporter substrate-binding protein n=1 Tax=Wenjunlia tyrosinilytica TaxID=1544741 RepID=A0A918E1R3_9ACTN|nr:ABC transporter substrate-binding protein [Wenjunlia tyrosinilytica]GGO97170.1 branched-chain amino acid ABC transporter substrate-binding protein [Wenjunlia tyrosinilytica]